VGFFVPEAKIFPIWGEETFSFEWGEGGNQEDGLSNRNDLKGLHCNNERRISLKRIEDQPGLREKAMLQLGEGWEV